MKKLIAGFCCLTAFLLTAFMISDFAYGIGGWSDIPTTKLPYQHFQKDRPAPPMAGFESTMYPLARKKVVNESDLLIDIDDFSYTGVIRASAYNPFVPLPHRPPPPKKTNKK